MVIPQKRGFVPIILLILVAIVVGIGGLAGTALLGQALKCPSEAGAARTEKELGNLLEKSGSVTVSDIEATTIAQKYIADKVDDARVCFTTNVGNASGNLKLGPLTPSFYASAGVDLSGATPKTTNLDIKIGSLPDIPVLSDQATQVVANLINENLAKVQLKKKYAVQFAVGSVTVSKLSE